MDNLLYTDIYDYENKSHNTPRYDKHTKNWRYYEGYGREPCTEKAQFLKSLNLDHPIWVSEATRLSSAGCIYSTQEYETLRQGDIGHRMGVNFIGETSVRTVSDTSVSMLDGRDRVDRISWNFSKMLMDFGDKTNDREGQNNFFKDFGKGSAWSKNTDMMRAFKPFFDNINTQLEDDNFKISLSDQSVKSYPRHHFICIRDLYNVFMDTVGDTEKIDKLDPEAKEFIPPVCVKPAGPPPPRRPSASCKNTTGHVTWDKNSSSYEELSQKLDKIINGLDIPVVHAERVIMAPNYGIW